MELREKKQRVNRLKICCFKMLLFFTLGITVIETNHCIINAKAKKGTRIKVIKQDINGTEQTIGCSFKECILHKKTKYGTKGCVSGSDLLNIQVNLTKKGKPKYKSLYDCKFKSMQGGCIKGNNLFLAFSDKGKNSSRKKDLTAIVKINLKENKVTKVTLVKGAAEKNIDGLGHANDLTYQNGTIYAAWYMTKGTGKKYSDKIGYIDEEIAGTGTSTPFSNKKEKGKISAFGITTFHKNFFALGIRYENKKTQRYIKTYKLEKDKRKKAKKKKGKKLFSLTKNKTFSTPQCMEYNKKYFYVVRFNKKGGKKNNNCIELYNKEGKRTQTYTIRDPKTKVNTGAIEKSDLINKKWEIETFSHYKGNTFYYTQFKPKKKNNKQAYLYKINLKAKAKSTNKKATKGKKKTKTKTTAKTKTKTTTKKKTDTKKKTKAKKKTKK